MGFFDWLTSSSPGGQVGQAAKEAITGVFDGVGKIIDEFHVSAEEKTTMKIALAEQKLKAVELLIDDVQNARSMQIQTRSLWPGVMSFMSTMGFFGGFVALILWGLPPNTDDFVKSIINMFAGAMIAAYANSQNFWLGSTNGSQAKDQMIYNSTPTKKDGA